MNLSSRLAWLFSVTFLGSLTGCTTLPPSSGTDPVAENGAGKADTADAVPALVYRNPESSGGGPTGDAVSDAWAGEGMKLPRCMCIPIDKPESDASSRAICPQLVPALDPLAAGAEPTEAETAACAAQAGRPVEVSYFDTDQGTVEVAGVLGYCVIVPVDHPLTGIRICDEARVYDRPSCVEGSFACDDGSCVSLELLCDGVADCTGEEDETDC